MNCIFERTSIRKYEDKPIEREKIDKILRAGFSAPSAKNMQPWEFVVVENKETLQKMSTVSLWSKMIATAALGMVVCCNSSRNTNMARCIMDCAAATENMLIEAKALGIGSVWIAAYDNEDRVEKLKELFDFPDNITPLWMISFGYPAENPKIKDKYKPEYIHYETW